MREDRLSALQVSAFGVGVMADVLEDAGIGSSQAFAAAGLNPEMPIPENGVISARSEVAFERAFNTLTPGRRDLWIEVGRRHRLVSYGLFRTHAQHLAHSSPLGECGRPGARPVLLFR